MLKNYQKLNNGLIKQIEFVNSKQKYDIDYIKRSYDSYKDLSIQMSYLRFENWKHRRPDEHLWHFNLESLTKFMQEICYEKITHSNIEDVIRKPSSDYTNILSAVFKKNV